jgi:hypothetical protein
MWCFLFVSERVICILLCGVKSVFFLVDEKKETQTRDTGTQGQQAQIENSEFKLGLNQVVIT